MIQTAWLSWLRVTVIAQAFFTQDIQNFTTDLWIRRNVSFPTLLAHLLGGHFRQERHILVPGLLVYMNQWTMLNSARFRNVTKVQSVIISVHLCNGYESQKTTANTVTAAPKVWSWGRVGGWADNSDSQELWIDSFSLESFWQPNLKESILHNESIAVGNQFLSKESWLTIHIYWD